MSTKINKNGFFDITKISHSVLPWLLGSEDAMKEDISSVNDNDDMVSKAGIFYKIKKLLLGKDDNKI